VIKWVIEQVTGTGNAVETPIGLMPAPGAIDTTGLNISDEAMQELLEVDNAKWKNEVVSIRAYFNELGDRLPEEMKAQVDALEKRLAN
jgi:phosphoenolpyruvate carboxykinase (GTP)